MIYDELGRKMPTSELILEREFGKRTIAPYAVQTCRQFEPVSTGPPLGRGDLRVEPAKARIPAHRAKLEIGLRVEGVGGLLYAPSL